VGLDILLINFGYTFVYTVALNWLVDMFCSSVSVLYGFDFTDQTSSNVEGFPTFRRTVQLPPSGSVALASAVSELNP
jgi:hypothetical protein